jgi:serine/threonine protein kinase
MSRDGSLVGQIVLGRYRVLRRLAQGGMGAVYLGRTEGAKGFTRPVVIKRILPALTDDEDTARMFVREARLLSMLQDPGIVSVVDFGHASRGGLVMVLDYVHGYHLGYWLRYLEREGGHMPAEMAIHITCRVLEALHYAHTFKRPDGRALQIVHRDVSPANVLLDVNGNVKLVDFGIARAHGDVGEYHTETPRLKGKFAYMPPEIFRGEEPTVQADVYASGVLLYELLTGDNPFRGKEITDTYHKVLNATPVPVESLRADVPKGIDAPIARAIAKDPSERFPSALAFATAIRTFRSVPEEVSRSLLRAEVQKAFAGPLADALGLEPLSARDAAWREASASDDDLQSASTAPPPPDAYEAATRVGDDPPTVVMEDSASAPVARKQGKPNAAATAAAEEAAYRVSSTGDRTIARSKPRSGRIVALLGALLLASVAAVAGLLVGRDNHPAEDRIVVIQRESNAAAPVSVETPTPSTEPAAAVAPAPEPAENAVPIERIATAEIGRSRTAKARVALAPNPQLLTRAFARQQQQVQACFAAQGDALEAAPALTFEFHVDPAGNVEQAGLLPAAAASTPLGACLLGVARSTKFPPLGEATSFRIPITARLVPVR